MNNFIKFLETGVADVAPVDNILNLSSRSDSDSIIRNCKECKPENLCKIHKELDNVS